MQSARGKSEHDIVGLNVGAGDDVCLFDHPHRETGEIVLTQWVHAGHLCRLATNECASSHFAAHRDTLNNLGGNLYIQLATGKVVEKEERFGTLHQDIVDTHPNQINTNGTVSMQLECQL